MYSSDVNLEDSMLVTIKWCYIPNVVLDPGHQSFAMVVD